ncbi:MAG: aldolase/citrate lyase family protein [Lautropia sp.]
MARSPLLDKIRSGGTALGLYVNSPDMVELCAYLGFDYFLVDQMFSANDWSRTEELIRAGEGAGITPVVRIQSNPWHGYDSRLAVDVTRALGVGAQFVTVSISGKREADECLEAGKDWHRKVMIIHYYKDYEEWTSKHEVQSQETFVMPLIESEGALAELDDIIRAPAVKIVRVAMTDSSRVLTGQQAPDWYHPMLWDRLDRAVALARQHGVVVGANTSYAYSLEELQKRIRLLHERGVRMILVQGANFLFQVAMNEFLKPLRGILR